jgi:hypothetical protein
VAAYLGATTAYTNKIPPNLALVAMVLALAISCLLALWYLFAKSLYLS